jgi:putative transferase (TIGR04331 family)
VTENKNDNQIFLATTALEEFWDTSKQLLFLGEWCRRFERKDYWEEFGGEVARNPLKTERDLFEAHQYVNKLYYELLPLLTNELNLLHKTSRSCKYWRILIGPWLYFYICVVLDRFLNIKSALKYYPDLTTILMAEKSFVTPKDTLDFLTLVCDDAYNLQIFSRILKLISPKKFPEKELSLELKIKKRKQNEKLTIKEISRRILNGLMMGLGAKVIFKGALFPLAAEMTIFCRSMFRIRASRSGVVDLPELSLDNDLRGRFENININRDEFLQIFFKLLPLDFPKCFVEGYQIMKDKIKSEYPLSPKAIFNSIGWYLDEGFKTWAAESSEKGIPLFGVPHGGNLGVDKYEEVFLGNEIDIVDHYFTWGWEEPRRKGKVKPLPVPKLINRKVLGAEAKRSGILFGASSVPRYLYMFHPFNNYVYLNYFNGHIRFSNSLAPGLRSQLYMRAYHNDYGWGYLNRLKEVCPEVVVEDPNIPFEKRIKDCRIYVCDHLSTTYAEALAVNKPTILFWDPKIFQLRPEAKPYFDALRSAGILYETPEGAAEAINSIYYDIEKWWNNDERQKTIKEFCQNYARTSSNAITEWVKELSQISENKL